MAKTPTSNIEKIMSSGGPNETPLDMNQFIQLADKETIEFDVMQDLADTIKRDFEKEKNQEKVLLIGCNLNLQIILKE